MPEQNSLAWALECAVYHDPRYFEGLYETLYGRKPEPPPPPPTEEQRLVTRDLVEKIFRINRPPTQTRELKYVFWN